ncbi:unnamed protein product [Mycena citricolor]|uniref:Glycosyl transferase CAP10 domain-containing protein n=1 Tax=Mycena citricolor TaxID=2018698 RepID=A0AAD2K8E6_9AGAR|nr:unnamed protein product [Mycena citricolor]CAK5284950.1 unnamed protein product [Mycena citricolor]
MASAYRDESTEQLLPHHFPKALLSAPTDRHQRTPCRYWLPFVGALTLLGMFSGAVYLPAKHPHHHAGAGNCTSAAVQDTEVLLPPLEPLSPVTATALTPELATAHQQVDILFSRQSTTLSQAAARHALKTGRAPPAGYERWWNLTQTQSEKCLVDEYEQVYKDFEPFYQLAAADPGRFARLVERGRELTRQDARGMVTVKIDRREVVIPNYSGTGFSAELKGIVDKFAHVLPDMEFLLNSRDEPRVVFDVQELGAQQNAMRMKDPLPFRIAPVPTSEFFRTQPGCQVLKTPTGFVSDPVDSVAFLRSSTSSDFTTDLWPVLSVGKISPCFSDILFPGIYYYTRSRWAGNYSHSNNISWVNKESRIYWRGSSTGGHIYGTNYQSFPRFRLIDIARTENNSHLIDAKLTAFVDAQCAARSCNRDAIVSKYDIHGPRAPREDVYRHKYALDVDGNSYSGRYLGLLRSGSLVFKSTAFEEYFSGWLRPYEHYIPVRPDLSDLVDKIAWAQTHDAEARAIQANGQVFAERVMTDAQNDCYFAAVLLEWSRLLEIARNATGVAMNGTGGGLKESGMGENATKSTTLGA